MLSASDVVELIGEIALTAVEQKGIKSVAPLRAAIATRPAKDRGFAGAPAARALGSIGTGPSITMY